MAKEKPAEEPLGSMGRAQAALVAFDNLKFIRIFPEVKDYFPIILFFRKINRFQGIMTPGAWMLSTRFPGGPFDSE